MILQALFLLFWEHRKWNKRWMLLYLYDLNLSFMLATAFTSATVMPVGYHHMYHSYLCRTLLGHRPYSWPSSTSFQHFIIGFAFYASYFFLIISPFRHVNIVSLSYALQTSSFLWLTTASWLIILINVFAYLAKDNLSWSIWTPHLLSGKPVWRPVDDTTSHIT